MTTARTATDLLDRVEAALAPVQRAEGLALWRLATTGDDEAAAAVERAQLLRNELLGDGRLFARVERLRDEVDPASPTGQRLARLRALALPLQGPPALRDEITRREVELEQIHATFRARFEGRAVPDHVLDGVLARDGDDTRRRGAWEATRQVGRATARRVRELARLRNRQAEHLGLRSYTPLALQAAEIDPPRLERLLARLASLTEAPYRRLKRALDEDLAGRFGVSPGDLAPWHYPDRFLQRLPEAATGALGDHIDVERIQQLTRRTFAVLDLPLDHLWDAADLLPRPGKQQHAFCLGIDSPRDVRVLANLDREPRWLGTALHEFGHAVYDAGLPPGLPLLLRQPAHPAMTEGVAMLLGRLVHDRGWLVEIAGVPRAAAERAAGELARQQLVFMRFALVVVRFEQALYADPDGDLDAAWWNLVGELQGLRRPAGHAGADWAAKVHVACYPYYYPHYVLGELVASQLHLAAARAAGRDDDPLATLPLTPTTGALLRRLFALGASRPWDDALRAVTGFPLSAEPYTRQMLGEDVDDAP